MINITQEQKKVLNDNGVMVSQFKLWCKKVNKVVYDVWRAIADCIVSLARSMYKALEPTIEAFADMAKRFDELTSYTKNDLPQLEIEINKHKPCMKIGGKYNPFIKRNVVFHCRNNC